MSTFFSRRCDLDALTGYKEAEIGENFLVFFDSRTGQPCMDRFDRPALEEILAMAEKFLPRIPSFPFRNEYGIRYLSKDDPRVLQRFLGLPSSLSDIRTKADIASISFRDDLLERKKEIDYWEFSPHRMEWHLRDFRSYLLSCGLYYPYDDENSFLRYQEDQRPVFIDEDLLSGELKKAYESFSSERLLIDVLTREADDLRYRYLQRFDGFSFNELLLYFLDDVQDERLDELADDAILNDDFAQMLRVYFLALVHLCQEEYYAKRLKRAPELYSYLSPKPVFQRDLLSYPGFTAEMYSKDGKTYFIDESARKRIQYLYDETMLENPDFSLPVVYARLGLPYQGYLQLTKKKNVTVKNLLKMLDFKSDIVYPMGDYVSFKREDVYGCYDFHQKEHLDCYLERRLLDEGIDLSYFTISYRETGYCLIIHPSKRRNAELRKIFDSPRCALMDYYLPYCLKEDKEAIPSLRKVLEELDEKSRQTACDFFFESFTGETIEEVSKLVLEQFDVPSESEDTVRFFAFLFDRLWGSVREEFRDELVQADQWSTLALLDSKENPNRTYESGLPYPYVSFGFLAYAFQLEPTGPAYLCSSQREAIEKAVRHYGEVYRRTRLPMDAKTISLPSLNRFLLERLGLPEVLLSQIDLDQPLLPQLPFLDSLSHLLHGEVPLRHEMEVGYSQSRVNLFFTYVRASGAKHGVYLPKSPIVPLSAEELQNQVLSGTFEGLFPGDMGKIDRRIDEYLQLPYQAFVAVLGIFDSAFLFLEGGMDQFLSLRDFENHFTYGIVLGQDESTTEMVLSAPQVFSSLSLFYQNLALAYAIDCAKKEIPDLESTTYLNAIPIQGLRHPLICPGAVFDAYQDEEEGPFFFSAGDRDAMERTLMYFSRSYDSKVEDPSILTALVLSLSGFPLPFILRCLKGNLSLDQSNVPDFLSRLRFEEDVKGFNSHLRTPVPSPTRPFFYLCQGPEVAFAHARTEMARHGFLLPTYYRYSELKFDPDYRYDLSAFESSHLPYFYTFTYENNYFLEQLLGADETLFDENVKEFLERTKDDAAKEAIRLIQEKRKENPSLIYHLLDELGSRYNYYRSLVLEFPDLNKQSDAKAVMNRILGFLTFLGEKVIRHYMDFAAIGGR